MLTTERCTTDENVRGRTVNRIIDLLNCFSDQEPVHDLKDISQRVGLAKSTTHRLVSDLVGGGLLMRTANGRGYQLGYQMLHWGTVAQSALELRDEALPILRALVSALDETAVLAVCDGTRCMYVEIVESRQSVRLNLLLGQPLPLHAGAASKAAWAFSPQTEIEGLLSCMVLQAFTDRTITDPLQLREELSAIRQRGYATSFEEIDFGAAGIAAPVFDHHGRPVAGIGIVAPITRIAPERVPEIAPAIVDTGRQLSLRLGALGPYPRQNSQHQIKIGTR